MISSRIKGFQCEHTCTQQENSNKIILRKITSISMELNALQIRRCEGVRTKHTVEQLIAHAVVLLPFFYLELNADE